MSLIDLNATQVSVCIDMIIVVIIATYQALDIAE